MLQGQSISILSPKKKDTRAWAMPWRCGGGRGPLRRAGESRHGVPKKGRHEHNQRNVEREASARLVAVHRDGLVAIGEHGRHRDEQRGHEANQGGDPAHDGGVSGCSDRVGGGANRTMVRREAKKRREPMAEWINESVPMGEEEENVSAEYRGSQRGRRTGKWMG